MTSPTTHAPRRSGHSRARRRARLAILAAVLIVLGVLGWLADVGWNAVFNRHHAVTTMCKVVGPAEVYTMDPEQLLNASTIANVAMQRNLPARALIVALATAQQESKLRNLNYGDADSVGLFQQRPTQGWGSKEQILMPSYAAGKFFDALLKVLNWQDLPVTQAAYEVQHNAYPNAYKDWEPRATALAGALTGTTSGQLTCRLAQPATTGSATAVTTGLRTDLDINHPSVVPLDSKRTTITLTGLGAMASGDDTAAKHRSETVAAWAVAHAASDGITSVVISDQEWRPDRAGWHDADKPAPAGTVILTVTSNPSPTHSS
jgi:hypothetical protein